MCGFAGVLGPASRARPEDVEAMARALEHRGPDDFGVWQGRFWSREEEHAVALGHTRLAVIDLSPRGHQPMVSEDGSLAIAYNGEIYNFRELRRELEDEGRRFRSDCDTEVLIEGYRVWGTRLFDRLVGMFAFALWEAPERRLLLVRDRLGIKPLYHRWADGVLTFGSELGALRRHGGFRAEIDRHALCSYLRVGYTCGEQTIYRDVHRLLPGSFLVWQDGAIRTEDFWSLGDETREPFSGGFERAVDELERLLGDAVECRMIADVPLGAFVSGGIDSTAVVALMQERSRRRVRTFSIGFREREYDESPFARSVAEHLGTDHTEFVVERRDAIEVAHQLPDLYDEPFADSSAIPTTLLSRLARQQVTVALSGDGGDELFAGYDRYARFHRLAGLLALPAPVRRALAGLSPLVPPSSLRNGLRHLASSDEVALAQSLTSHFDPEALEAALPGASASRALFASTYRSAPTRDPVKRLAFADARTYLPDDILTKVDRASMSVALEVRVPILDHRVVRFALRLPRGVLWHEGRTKAPLRALATRRVPRALLERPKHGFGIPIHVLLEQELRAWRERFLAPERIIDDGLFDPAGVERLVQQATGLGALAAERLWFLLCFQRWFARHHRGEPDA